MKTAAIFDMDGTVLDTLSDLKNAVNYAMKETGHKCDFTRAETALCFGSAAYVALQRALAIERGITDPDALLQIGTKGHETVPGVSNDEAERILAVYRPYYDSHCTILTGPYRGIREAIAALRHAGIACAVVSNKPDEAVQSLVRKDFPEVFDFSLGEKAGVPRKPAPDMVQACLAALGKTAEEAVYIGDTEIDIRTAANAGMPCISVTWGFRQEDFLRRNGGRRFADTPEEMAQMILSGEV